MPKLHALSPLGFATPHKDMVGAYAISEVTDRAMVSVTARKDCGAAVKTILTKILKQPAPEVGGYCAGEIEAFWTHIGCFFIRVALCLHVIGPRSSAGISL